MRLWHQELIEKLPRQQLLGQWRECCALLGKGWGRKHSIVDYVFKYDKQKLANYSYIVAKEMIKRGYKPKLNYLSDFELKENYDIIYNEHNEDYLIECLDNLKNKGVIL